MGEGEFIEGVSNFLVDFAFTSAVTEDLFVELAAVSSEGLDIVAVSERSHGVSLSMMSKKKELHPTILSGWCAVKRLMTRV